MHQSNIFLFFKNYFWYQHIKTIWKHKFFLKKKHGLQRVSKQTNHLSHHHNNHNQDINTPYHRHLIIYVTTTPSPFLLSWSPQKLVINWVFQSPSNSLNTITTFITILFQNNHNYNHHFLTLSPSLMSQ